MQVEICKLKEFGLRNRTLICAVLWLEVAALFPEALGGKGDELWLLPLFHTAKPHRLYTSMYYFLFWEHKPPSSYLIWAGPVTLHIHISHSFSMLWSSKWLCCLCLLFNRSQFWADSIHYCNNLHLTEKDGIKPALAESFSKSIHFLKCIYLTGFQIKKLVEKPMYIHPLASISPASCGF